MVRSRDRRRVLEARQRRRPLWLLWLLVGPGMLAMLGENDGPSMLSYAASGATFGIGFFLPFIAVTFVGAMVVQEMAMRVGAVTHRGYGELVFQRFGPLWGWFAALDLGVTNLVTLVTEFIAIKVGLGFFGIPTLVAAALGVGLVLASISGGRYWRWERVALSLAGFNLLFVVCAVLVHPDPGSVARAFATWTPLPNGSTQTLLLLIASDIGATVTPWMIFFQQSAVVDKGLTPRDIPQGRIDTVAGGVVAAVVACAAVVTTAVLFSHHIAVGGPGGASFAQALRPIAGLPVAGIFAVGLVEAGALASLTISASTAYAFGEAVAGAHSFNRRLREAPLFYAFNTGMAAIAAAVVLIPGAPLLAITLNANLLATVLMPAALVLLLMLANDRQLMGPRVNSRAANWAGILVGALVGLAGCAYAVLAFHNVLAGHPGG